MNIGCLGAGKVARVLGAALSAAGENVVVSGRRARTEQLAASPSSLPVLSVQDAAAFGDVLVLAVNPWTEIEAVVKSIPSADLRGKTIVDLSNDIVFTDRPHLAVADKPLGQRIQAWIPEARIVKVLNYLPAEFMVNPRARGIAPAITWMAGDDAESKETVRSLLVKLGWDGVVDLGGIEQSRLQEVFGLSMALILTRHLAALRA